MDTQRRKHNNSRKLQPLSSLENHIDLLEQRKISGRLTQHEDNINSNNNNNSTRTYKQIRPARIASDGGKGLILDDNLEDKRQKENIPPLRFQKIITSPPTSTERHRDTTIPVNITNSPTSNRNRFISQTFVTSATHRRAEPTRTTRPTIGGKTISSSMISKINSSVNSNNNNNNNNTFNNNNNNNNSNNNINSSTMDENSIIDNQNNINNNSTNNNNNQHKRTEQKMSTEQLKMLSRRIDPSLPVSPHGSPCKPALPSIFTNNERSPKRSSSTHILNKNMSSSSLSKTYSCQEPHSYSLYQTCIDLWPTEPTLGDFSSDNIKSLTDLLKVRLSQAKYRILAQLEDEEKKELQGKKYQKMYPSITPVASSLLRDDVDYSTWPTFEKHTIELSSKRSNVFVCVSGNGKNLFHHRDSYLQRHRHQQQYQLQLQQRKKFLSHSVDDLGKYSTVSFPPPPPPPPPSSLHHQKKDLKRKRRSKSKSLLPSSSPSSLAASSSTTTKDARSQRENEARLQASQVQPVVLEDGSQSFVCAPCNKKYKTRNGLAYHLSRCTYQNINDIQTSASSSSATLSQEVEKEHDQESTTVNKSSQENPQPTTTVQDDSKASIVYCICEHPNDDNGMMVQCDECQSWLHVGCVGMADAVLDDIYNCPRCIDRLMKRPKISSNTNTSETSTTVTNTTTNPALVVAATQDDLTTTLNNNALLLQQLNETTETLNFPALSSIPSSSSPSLTSNNNNNLSLTSSSPSSSNIKPTQQQQQSAVWDDFDILDNSNSSNNNNNNDHETNTPNINNENNNNSNSNINNMWGLSADIPSLLYSDATMMTSTLDDDIPSYLMDLPSSELSPHDLQPTDWFQFANFDDDFCEF